MQVRVVRPVIISYVNRVEKTYKNGAKFNSWSFSFPLSRKKRADGTYETFYQTGWWADKTQAFELKDKQQLCNCVFDIVAYFDKQGIRRYAWFLKEYDRTNNGEKMDDDFNLEDAI